MSNHKRSWTDEELIIATVNSTSYRQVIIRLNLVPAGGNYEQVQAKIKELNLDTSHFLGMGWNIGLKFKPNKAAVESLLKKDSHAQSYGLKHRLFKLGMLSPKCEQCGWAEHASDGRIPVELDHINGDHYDNRLENLRILCPNCHSLQPTHRGKNKKVTRKML